jgi:Ni/Fe-hydrogenase subunit HybB-like protein
VKTTLKDFSTFVRRGAALALQGDWRYYVWLGLLFALCLLGLNAYAKQFVRGLITTGMTDQVCWGVYIANFTFLVGVAAAAVMLVIPVYVYKNDELHDLVFFGELLAIAAILMCLAFVMVDLGRPDRFWHLIPGIGQFNFPGSMLSWDVIVLNGYLALNVYLCAYLLFCRYRGQEPTKWLYLPIVFLGIVWAVSIHTVTAFLYVGLGGRPYWNSAIVGPRFIASAFTAGPALIILALQIIRRVTVPRNGRHNGEMRKRFATSRRATVEDFNWLAARIPALAAVSEEIRLDVVLKSTVFETPAGATIVRQGERDADAFYILNGRVSIVRTSGGSSRKLGALTVGDLFGEITPLTGTPRTADVIADEPTILLHLPAKTLRELMRDRQISQLILAKMRQRLVITDRALLMLRSVVQVAMLINVFLLLNEVFKEFYTADLHGASARYLYFGLHGHNALVPWIWTAITFNVIAMILFVLPLSRSLRWLDVACVLAIVGIWIEKGMGLVVPGFVPSPLGEIVEYSPTWNETLICFGIWAFGLLCYTVLLRVAVPILEGKFAKTN